MSDDKPNVIEVGDVVMHRLTKRTGIVLFDLRENPWTSKDWQVQFGSAGCLWSELTTRKVYEVEIERVNT